MGEVLLTAPGPSREAAAHAAEALLPELEALAHRLADVIHDGMEGVPQDMQAATAASCRANIGLITSMLIDGLDPTTARAPSEALHYAREYVRNGLPIELLMQAYRVAHADFWQVWLNRLREDTHDGTALAEAVAFSSEWMFRYIDTVCAEISRHYQQERERWVRSAAAMRTEEVRAILEGRQSDEQAASTRLRYALDRTHLAFVVWAPDGRDHEGALGDCERLAHEAARRAGGVDLLSIVVGGDVVAAWTGVRGELDLEGLLRAPAEDSGVRMAVGTPGRGLEGFRRSHEEAMRARRCALLVDEPSASCVRFADVALLSLLTADPDEARRFVARELGALADEAEATRRLASTLRVFLDEDCSFVRAARRLNVHENTVAYRVRRAADLLGHGLDERRLELRVALELGELLG